MPRFPLAIVLWSAVALASTPARAQEALEAARTSYAAVDYDLCRAESARALKQPGDRAARVEAHKLHGLCLAALGDTDSAREAFKNMLAIDPNARLPDGLSPRFTASFREAKGALVRAPLALSITGDEVHGGTRTLLLALTDDLQLAKDIAWRGEGGVLSPATRAAAKLELEVPENVAVSLVVLDVGGGEILTLDAGRHGDGRAPPPADGATEGDGENGVGPLFIVAGIAAGVVVVGGAAVLAAVLLAPPDAVSLKTDVAFRK